MSSKLSMVRHGAANDWRSVLFVGTTRRALVVLLSSLVCMADVSAGELDMKLINATFQFQLCVRTTTERELADATPSDHDATSLPVNEMEARISAKVLDACKKHFGDMEKGLILLHYNGNTMNALGYWEGVVYSARVYVISKTIEYRQRIGSISTVP